MPEQKTLIGYDLAEFRPWLEAQRRRRRNRLIYKPKHPSLWILLGAFLGILAVEISAAHAWAWWWYR